jgi:sarcosine oxidase subunit beta
MEAADVLVIGGGLVGCATAWHLAQGGASVLVVEAGDLNAGASGQNAGSLHFQIERRFLENGEALADQAARTIALSRLAIEEWRGLEAALGEDLEVVMGGGLMVAETPAEMALLEAKARREAEWGLPTRLIDAGEVQALAPYLSPHILGASYMAEEGHANPRTLTRAFAAAAVRAGARLMTGCRVTSIARSAGRFVVELDQADETIAVDCAAVLIAAGAWTSAIGALANVHLPVFPAGLTMNVTERVPDFLPHLVQHVGRRLSMKQAHSGNVLIGGGWASRLAQRPGGGFDLSQPPTLLPEALKANLKAAVDTVPRVAGLNLIRSWTGIVAITADQLPLVGEVPQVPGLYVAAGGSAFTLGPTFARLMSALIQRQPHADEPLAMFAPARFGHLNSFMG